jgi:hypothetical protein
MPVHAHRRDGGIASTHSQPRRKKGVVTRYPRGRSGGARKIAPTGIRSRTVQPASSRYTDYAIPAAFYVPAIKH